MKKLLYISVNSKPENMSTSKTAGRYFVNRFMTENTDYTVEELDLYNEYIPEPIYKYFKGRAELVTGAEYDSLSEYDKKAVDRMNQLSDQFVSADTYVIAAPMWSVSFPSILKRYLDCIILNNKIIKVSSDNVDGLLEDKKRNMVYIQSSGGIYPKILGANVNHGTDYFGDIFKFLGITKFQKVLIEGVDMPEVGKDKALQMAYEEMEVVIKKFSREPILKK